MSLVTAVNCRHHTDVTGAIHPIQQSINRAEADAIPVPRRRQFKTPCAEIRRLRLTMAHPASPAPTSRFFNDPKNSIYLLPADTEEGRRYVSCPHVSKREN